MNDPRHQLTPKIQADICSYIRAGGFPNVAAEVAGVPQKVFDRWMRCGRATRPVPVYRDFYEAVCMAQAQARLRAENHAFEHAPITWLKSGPGKETARTTGWTSPVKPRPLPQKTRSDMSISEERMQTYTTVILGALKPFPEARAAAADALDAAGLGNEPVDDPLPETMEQAAPVCPPGEKAADKPEAPAQGTAPPSVALQACEQLAPQTVAVEKHVERTEPNAPGTSEVAVPQREVEVLSPAPVAEDSTAGDRAAAPAASVAEVKVFRAGGEPAVEPPGRREQAATNLHRTETKEQQTGVESGGKPQRKEPTLAEVQREMVRNLLQSG